MKRYLLAAIGTLLIVPASVAQAQACMGMTSMATMPMNLLVGAEFTDGAKSFNGRFGFGSSIMFGGVSGSITDVDGVDGTAKTIGIDGGLSYITGASRALVVCPIADLSYTMFPDIEILGEDYGSSLTTGSAGLALGAAVRSGATMTLIPFAALRAIYSRIDVDIPSVGNDEDSDSETYGMLSGGLSFAFTDAVLVRPIINIPFGLEGSDISYGVGLVFSFGRR